MDTAVALVGAYLRFNGYISLPEQPILVGQGRPWRYHTATDLDILAVRFPHAAVIVPRDRGGPPWQNEDLRLATDPMLDLHDGTVDVLVCEVKEGRPRLNDALRDPTVLMAALSRLDAGFDDPLERIIRGLIERGEAKTEAGGRRWRFRLVAFGDGSPVIEGGPFHSIPLRHAALFLMRTMAEHRQVWRDAQFGDAVLDFLHLLDKLGLGMKWIATQTRIEWAGAAGGSATNPPSSAAENAVGATTDSAAGGMGGAIVEGGAGSAGSVGDHDRAVEEGNDAAVAHDRDDQSGLRGDPRDHARGTRPAHGA
ncbi:MAG: hypothetical protein FWJ74_10890 [Gemmatimonadota bacterium]